MTAETRWIVTATPPTPNGDLHVGHLSGPYLSADVFRRLRLKEGVPADYICYGDDNQSYVDTTARRLGEHPRKLAEESNAKIRETLAAFDIELTRYALPDSEHAYSVRSAFSALYASGALHEVAKAEPHDVTTGRMLFESYYSGYCPVCLCPTNCGICEACGHPNKSDTLIMATSKDDHRAQLQFEQVRKLVLPVEPFRARLVEFFASKRGIWRPHILELADQLLTEPLAEIDITFEHDWGLSVGLPGWEGHVFNVWAEMGLGLVSLAQRATSDLRGASYAQFLGYDNSYFFLIVHPALHFALEDIGYETTRLVDFIYTNEFYNLEGKKFSTSQGHLIWGRDLLDEMSSDRARFHLALNGPELSESNFVLQSAIEELDQKLVAPLRRILLHLERLEPEHQIATGTSAVPEFLRKLERRRRYYASPEHFSASKLARISHELLAFLSECWPADPDVFKQRDFLIALRFWAEITEPFTPRVAQEILHAFSENSVADLESLMSALREFIADDR